MTLTDAHLLRLPMLHSLPRPLVPVIVSSLLSGCDVGLKPQPFLLRCQLGDGATKVVRVDPHAQTVQERDPRTRETINTFETFRIPDPAAQGLVDETKVTISSRQIHWEIRRFRPQMEWESHTIDRSSLLYRGEYGSFTDLEPSSVTVRGTCHSSA